MIQRSETIYHFKLAAGESFCVDGTEVRILRVREGKVSVEVHPGGPQIRRECRVEIDAKPGNGSI